MKQTIRKRVLLAFVGMAVLLVCSQVVGQEATNWLETVLEWAGLWSLPGAAIGFSLLLCLVVLAGYLLASSDPRPDGRKQFVQCMLALLALVLSNAVPGWCFSALGLSDGSGVCRFVLLVVLIGLWCVLWYQVLPVVQQWFQTPIDLAATKKATPPIGPVTLIALVSKIDPSELLLDPLQPTAELVRGRHKPEERRYRLSFGSLAEDIASLEGSRWPWQQLLRAVKHYAPRARLQVVLVGSKTIEETDGGAEKDRGSFEQLESLCRPFLERYPELREAKVTVFPHPLDFENFNEVKDRIRDCIEDECRSVEEPNVFVDITGGFKVASAAAAMATIGTHGQFQYVQTRKEWEVLVSDLHPQVMPSAGG